MHNGCDGCCSQPTAALKVEEGPTRGLADRSVLVAEKDALVAEEVRGLLSQMGANVVGPATNLSEALELVASSQPDAAVIGIDLGAGPSFKLARALDDQGIPFSFFTGYGETAIPADLRSVPRLDKPANEQALLTFLKNLVRDH